MVSAFLIALSNMSLVSIISMVKPSTVGIIVEGHIHGPTHACLAEHI